MSARGDFNDNRLSDGESDKDKDFWLKNLENKSCFVDEAKKLSMQRLTVKC